jgi:general secretion pathway protein N
MNDNGLTRSLLLWGIPFAIVLGALGYETDWGRGIGPETARTKAGTPPPVTVALLPEYKIVGGVEARKETVDRVLFNPTRRPAPPAVATASSGGSRQNGLYVLTGTSVTGGLATAFLREVKGGKSHTVHQGETLDGDLVAEVTADRVRLGRGTDAEELQLKLASGPKTTIQVAPPPPPTNPAQPGIRPGLGGSGQPVPNAGGPAARPAPPNAINPNAQRAGGTASVSEILAERRRAARAAAAAASAGAARPQQ